MATKKYTVTLPVELAEGIRAEVGAGGFSRYVTQAIERQRERDNLGDFVRWLEAEHGPVSDDDRTAAEAERLEIEQLHAARKARRKASRKAG